MKDGELERHWTGLLDRLGRHGAAGLPSPDLASLPELMDTYRVPGVGIAVAHRDGRSWSAGFGTTGAAPVADDTVFQACSISKHVTAFGALRLVADGVLDLDADVGEYLTTWRLPAGASVTVRQLLAHTAGLTYNWFRGYGADEPTPTLLQTLEGVAPANTPPVRAALLPGSRFRYSGSHYAVLEQLMVDVTGTAFDELLRALVLDPVAMADSSFDQRFPHRRRSVAAGHHRCGTPVPGGWHTQPEMAGGGLWSTPADLLRLDLEIASAAAGESELLGRDLATQMLTPQLPGTGYGLGTELDDTPGRRKFGHSGENVGYTCFSYAWPDSGAAVAVMTNSDDTMPVQTAILAAAGRLYAAAAAPAATDVVTGRYLLRDDYPLDVEAADGGLTLTAAGGHPAVLLPVEGGRYRHPVLDLEIDFRPGGLELRQEGVAQTATRIAGDRR
ncbi:serine hydrolase domain-containing protein [Actinoplanes sp. NPDC049668]|uniref:serine hydrolase domain-containing protein n=1 Tax=unclassified Actinoplanes TaxID=2626549 RepID=UPI0033AFE2CE